MFSLRLWLSACRYWTLVVPMVDATVNPARSSMLFRSLDLRVIILLSATKVVIEKPCVLARSAVLVVTPHSRSSDPLATRARRVAEATGTSLTSRSGRSSFCRTASTTLKHRSIE